jgi:hypothetical protein
MRQSIKNAMVAINRTRLRNATITKKEWRGERFQKDGSLPVFQLHRLLYVRRNVSVRLSKLNQFFAICRQHVNEMN